jgi:hypothetical protein
MSWIDERMAESSDAGQSVIAEEAEKVYETFWKEITEFADEAKAKGFMIKPNGSPYERAMRLFRNPHDQRSSEELRLALAADKKTIIGTTPNSPQFRFDLGICEDGIVCLKIDGEKIPIRKAAMKIVDRWLFPDLPPRY